MGSKNEIIVIKRIKKVQGGHHGGMWKIAYADFVTAMMVFFLLMWLITATPKQNLQGVAKYFTPTSSKGQDKGLGFDGGLDPNVLDGVYAPHSSSSSLVYGAPISGPKTIEENTNPETSIADKRTFSSVINSIQQQISSEIKEHIAMDITPEGLRIQIMDSDNRPMFAPGTDEIQPYMAKILTIVGSLIKNQPNYISISGHTASFKDPALAGDVNYWRLSVLRSDKVRLYLKSIIKNDQVMKLLGMADKEPFDNADPYGPKNIRIAITLLNNSQVDKTKQSVPNKIFDDNKK
ncbi:MAG: flagellar motor protein MotB [Pseudomonadota bacterium]